MEAEAIDLKQIKRTYKMLAVWFCMDGQNCKILHDVEADFKLDKPE